MTESNDSPSIGVHDSDGMMDGNIVMIMCGGMGGLNERDGSGPGDKLCSCVELKCDMLREIIRCSISVLS